MNAAGKSSQNDGPSTKDEGESSVLELFDRNTFQIGKMAQGSKDGKTRDNREERVGACDDTRVQECGLVSLAMGTKKAVMMPKVIPIEKKICVVARDQTSGRSFSTERSHTPM